MIVKTSANSVQANSLGYAGFTTQRPNLVGNPTLPASERSPARWFDTAAFATADQFTIGSASRNPVRGPSYRNVDLSLMRRLTLSGTRSAELRVEIFNLLKNGEVDAFALSRDQLNAMARKIPGTKVLGETFKQTVTAVAVPLDHPQSLAFASKFMTDALANGTVRKAYDDNGLKDTPIRTQ